MPGWQGKTLVFICITHAVYTCSVVKGSLVPRPSAWGEGRPGTHCSRMRRNYRHSGNSVALACTSPRLNYRNVGNFGACANGLPSPCGRPGNEARSRVNDRSRKQLPELFTVQRRLNSETVKRKWSV